MKRKALSSEGCSTLYKDNISIHAPEGATSGLCSNKKQYFNPTPFGDRYSIRQDWKECKEKIKADQTACASGQLYAAIKHAYF